MSSTPAPSLCERYHAATIYTPESVGRHAGLDFAAQPSPFKSWYQARRVSLGGGPSESVAPSPGPLDIERLGRLLYHTYGVTLVREFPGMSMHYRAAPSAGGLYPAELYVAVRDIPGIPDGILDYQATDHSLALCWEGDFWRDLDRYTFGHPAVAASRAILIGTAIYERSAWRYHDRAYRRVLLDTGHMFGNAVLVAPQDGHRVVPIPDFLDEGINSLLLLDQACEATLLLGALVEQDDAASNGRVPVHRSPVLRDAETPAEGRWIPVVHTAGALDAAQPAREHPVPDPGPDPVGEPMALDASPLAPGKAVLESVRRRRSTRNFTTGPVSLAAVGRILAHAYPRPDGADPEAWLCRDLLQTYVVVSAVTDLAQGVYRYDADAHTLALVRQGNPRAALYDCCLRQELGRDCALAVVHTFDLPAAIQRYGERAYRTAHLEAGLIGERLDLAALRLGYGASGIGGFFDEFVNALLLLDPRHAVAYITTIGVPA